MKHGATVVTKFPLLYINYLYLFKSKFSDHSGAAEMSSNLKVIYCKFLYLKIV